MAERAVTADILIRELCRELHMSEERLLIHLAIEHADQWLSEDGQRRVLLRARSSHERGVFVVDTQEKDR